MEALFLQSTFKSMKTSSNCTFALSPTSDEILAKLKATMRELLSSLEGDNSWPLRDSKRRIAKNDKEQVHLRED